jgi:hypothetical protein
MSFDKPTDDIIASTEAKLKLDFFFLPFTTKNALKKTFA